MITQILLDVVARMCKELNESNSQTRKLEILKVYHDSEAGSDIGRFIEYVHNPFKKFNVSSTNVRKYMKDHEGSKGDYDLFVVLDKLILRTVTGTDALKLVSSLIASYPEHEELILNIFDKNLKVRINSTSINKVWENLIPSFSVSLCNSYQHRAHKVNFYEDEWYASRKLDGCRCILMIDSEGKITTYARSGREFTTLDNLKQEFAQLNLRDIVFDGELCIVDDNGDEDFQAIMHEIKRKNYTISRPMYQVFDMMTKQEFESHSTSRRFTERYAELSKFFADHNLQYSRLVDQVKITDDKHFESLKALARENTYEGLVIRKDDTVICERSDSMLKVKEFIDAEYVVESVEIGPFRTIVDGREVVQDVVSNIIISHKGYTVSVGSGFSLEDRIYYKDHQDELLGATVTVKYFEETTDDNGCLSLRFPTIKHIYKTGRDI